ncbi:hypothetical protein [Solibacillus daqui]|uniref:hypothetical protein n=1 Tax=Solibacillus daqui TaxID=2912187 RepID=UPI00236664F1|nr:hypothetical protein [Solibacillus daqui]
MEILNLTSSNYSMFSSFLNPNHFKSLQLIDANLWGIGLVDYTRPIGTLIADINFDNKSAVITHLVVNDEENAHQFIMQLYNEAKNYFEKIGFLLTEITITVNSKSDDFINILTNQGWNGNVQGIDKYVLDFNRIQQDEWLWNLKTPTNLSVVPWNQRVNEIFTKAISSKNKFDNHVYPFVQNLGVIDEEFSFALLHEGDIVGWCIAERVAQNMILLPHSYVKRLPATRLGGGGMLVYAPVVKKAREKNMFVTFFTDVDNASMQNIINRRFKECIIQKKLLVRLVKK